MKTVIYKQFGNAEVLQITEKELPRVDDNSILVKVKAASINPIDWKLFQGEMKMMWGKKFPKAVGIDFSGIIEATGNNVGDFKPGDEVIGLMDIFNGGALAEYVVVKEKDIAIKPASISFEQAAALPVAGLSALQIVDKLAHVKRGTEVLINGATGGIGMFLTQFAKRKGAIVTSVSNTKGVVLAKHWQSDFTVDYKEQDVLKLDKQYDVVVDLSGKMPFNAAKVLLKKKATYVNTAPSPLTIAGSFINNLFSERKVKILFLKPSPESLKAVAKSAESKLDIVIDRTFPIDSFREAYRYAMKGGILGKVVISFP
jgi:NADPH:quinone reductase-like Zn-dependent oxidoreductase